MSKTLQTLTTIAIVLLGVATAVQAQNLTVKITKTDGSTAIVTAAASLQAAIGSTPLNEVTQLKISAGRFNTADWSWLRTNRSSLDALTHFTITNNITSVADMPSDNRSFFYKSLQEVNVAKLGKIGSNAFAYCTSLITASFPQATTIELQAFYSCNSLSTTSFLKVTTVRNSALYSCSSLTTVNLPRVTSIGSFAFSHCTLLTNILLGATPPDLSNGSFNEGPTARYLILVDAAGNRLTGSTLTNARNAYKAIADGNTSDNFWQGWNFGQTMYKIESTSMNNGTVWVSCNYSPAGAAVTVNPQPNTGYMLSSLTYTYSGKTPIPITDGSFTMPAANVTINAVFEVNTLNVIVNGENNKQGISLEQALNGIELGSITSLTVTAGSINTTDWLWLKNNRNSLTSLTSFTITDDITTVADIPDTGPAEPNFNSNVQTVNVAKVSSIGSSVFYGCNRLTTAGFPQVNKIGDYAFANCSSLSTTNFPQATSIEEYAFSYCTTLTTANFPQVTTIGTYAFRNCIALTFANFPQVNAIGDYTFLNCTFLATASFTKITSIRSYAFSNCSQLTNLKLNATPPTVSSNNPFSGCPVIRYLILTDAAGNQLTGNALTNARKVYRTVPDGNTSDDYWQGWDFGQTLYQITLAPMSNGTVSGCSDYLVEGASVTLIPQPNTGYTLSGLSYTHDGGTPTPIINNTFEMPAANVTITATFKVNTLSVTINGTTVKQGTCLEEALNGVEPGSIKSLTVTAGSFSTADWEWLKSNRTCLTSLTSFTITDGVAYVANIPSTASGSPYFNSNIQKLKVANVSFIGNYAFSDCTSLTSVDFPKVNSIGTFSFSRCTSLTTAGFPQAAIIENYAFYHCTHLAYLILGTTPPATSENAFINCPATRNLILVDAADNQLTGSALRDARNAYKAVSDGNTSDDYWQGWDFGQTLYKVTLSPISNGVVSGCSDYMAEGASVTLIPQPNTGYTLSNLTYTPNGGTPTPIANNTFEMPATNVTITATFKVNTLGVTINSTTVKQGTCLEEALNGVEPGSMTSLTITAGWFHTADWEWLKNNCSSFSSLTGFTITDGITAVEDIPATNKSYFSSNIREINVAKVSSIGEEAFFGCTSLTMASFPQAASIEEYAFFGCTSLTNMVLNATPPAIFSNMVFANCPPTRNLILVDEAGNQLTGTALIDTRNAYKAVNDGDKSDNYWYGWTIENNIACYRVSIAADILNGIVLTSANSILPQGSTVTISAMPNHGYKLKTGSLKAYKTGDKSMVVTITNGMLTMPAYNATITAEFERDGPTSVETQTVVSLGLYPNPCRDQVYIKGLVDYAQVEVYAHTGSQVLSVQLSPSRPLNLQSLPPGIYLVKVNGVTLKLLKNK